MKSCSVVGCIWPVFGTDKNTGFSYCKMHQWRRTDLKRLRPYKKKEEDSSEKWNPVTSFGYTSQTDMFLQLWHDADKENHYKGIYCPFTGKKLDHYKNTKYFWQCFAHILPKGRYTYFRLNPANIRIVEPSFHQVVDQGSLDDRKRHPEWKFDEWDELVLRMKSEYIEFKRDNLLA